MPGATQTGVVMVWFRVDDGFFGHPKVISTSSAALGLWVLAGSWSCANQTKGKIPNSVLSRLAPQAFRLARQLVAAGLWTQADDGFVFHDWHDYQIEPEKIAKRREGGAARQARFRANRAGVTPDVTRYVTGDVTPLVTDNVTPQVTHNVTPLVTRESRSPRPLGLEEVYLGGEGVTLQRGRTREEPALTSPDRPSGRCAEHAGVAGEPPPCRRCGDARRATELAASDAGFAEVLRTRRCPFCDTEGWIFQPGTRVPATPYRRCSHQRPGEAP